MNKKKSIYLSINLSNEQAGGMLHPVGCDVVYLAEQVDLHWPSRLALSPIDGSLYIVDENQVRYLCIYLYPCTYSLYI